MYYINEDIHNGHSVCFDGYFRENYDDLTGFWMQSGFLLLLISILSVLQKNQDPIFYLLMLLPIKQALGIIGKSINTEESTLFKKISKKTISVIPWYILHALLRDTLLICSIYQYHNINYLIATYALFELYMVQKSLFYKPLLENLYNQYTAKNTVSVVTY